MQETKNNVIIGGEKLGEKQEEKGSSTWIEFLLNSESESVKMARKEDDNLKEAFERLEFISGDEELRRIVELKRKYILDQNSMMDHKLEEGRREGKREGRKQEKKKTAKKMLAKNMNINDIVEITGLTEEEIKKLNEKRND